MSIADDFCELAHIEIPRPSFQRWQRASVDESVYQHMAGVIYRVSATAGRLLVDAFTSGPLREFPCPEILESVRNHRDELTSDRAVRFFEFAAAWLIDYQERGIIGEQKNSFPVVERESPTDRPLHRVERPVLSRAQYQEAHVVWLQSVLQATADLCENPQVNEEMRSAVRWIQPARRESNLRILKGGY